MRRLLLALAATALAAQPAAALPSPDPRAKVGANHHIGDASFRARFHRAPRTTDAEQVRMTTHLAYVRDWLAARPATRPDLEARRKELLGYLSDYVAKGTTPTNAHVPWRTPVFIDDAGTICAVGYLIERSAGRALPERIAREHRYDFIDDIAEQMPEVARWVADSGFSLEELATIQPAYAEPTVRTWRTWDLAKYPPPDGPYVHGDTTGAFRHGQMEGTWKVVDDKGVVMGSGDFARGRGAWTSYYANGARRAVGAYVDNRASGPWQLFHPSGNLAAEGRFAHGDRTGAWRFYDDTPAHAPIAEGAFGRGGEVVGTWKHYGAGGALVATSATITPPQWHDADYDMDGGEGFLLDVRARPGEVAHRVHQGTVGGAHVALDEYARDADRLYVQTGFDNETMFDASGFALAKGESGAWTASDCHWSAARKAMARADDVARLHGALYGDAARRVHATGKEEVGNSPDAGRADAGPRCGAPVAIAAERGARLDALLASREAVRSIPPAFVRAMVLGEEDGELPLVDPSMSPEAVAQYWQGRGAIAADLARILETNMAMYLEWPHIDGRFVQLYETLPGRVRRVWYDGDPEAQEREAELDAAATAKATTRTAAAARNAP